MQLGGIPGQSDAGGFNYRSSADINPILLRSQMGLSAGGGLEYWTVALECVLSNPPVNPDPASSTASTQVQAPKRLGPYTAQAVHRLS